MKTTKYEVYGTFNDLIKLYRRALKKGYSYGDIEPLPDNDSVKTYSTKSSSSAKYGRKPKRYVQINGSNVTKYGRGYGIPKILYYRNYSPTTVNVFDFELFKLTLVREYE